MKKLIVFLFSCFVSVSVLAGFIETDWRTGGDGALTLVEELNLEILDITYTQRSHVDMTNLLATNSQYADFRFMSKAEMKSIMFMLSDNIYMQEPEDNEKAGIRNFLALIGASSSGSWMFTTCDDEDGCNTSSDGEGLYNGERHVISPDLLFWANDPMDGRIQMVVRQAIQPLVMSMMTVVPEPSALLLLLSGLFVVFMRKIQRSTIHRFEM